MSGKRIKTMFELVYLLIMSVLGMLLITVAIASGWKNNIETWAFFVLMISWAIYLLDIGKRSGRLVFYTVFSAAMMIYYGSLTSSFTDVPIIICLFITVVSFGDDKRLQNILLWVFPILIFYHFVNGYVGPGMGSLAFARIILGIFCIIGTYIFTYYILLQKKAEEEKMNQLEQKLLEAEKKSEKFMANVSHQLLTPINAVNGSAQIIMDNDLEPKIARGMEMIYSAGKRLNAQISDIIDYSELVANELVISDTDYDISVLVNDLISNFVWSEKYDLIEYVVDVTPDIPSLLHGDADKIRKIMNILIENAFKFTSSGGVYVRVSKTDESYGINLVIEVMDTGEGMDDEQIESLYRNFSDYNMNDTKFSGLGLGMMIMYGFVSKMEGSINIQSKKGLGTTIRVSIPQMVVNSRPVITLPGAEDLRVMTYFSPSKYIRAEISEFYQEMINHIRVGVGIDIIQGISIGNMKTAVEEENLTHMAISTWEYELDAEFFEGLPSSIKLLVVCDKQYIPPKGSRMITIKKPLYIQNVINVLKNTMGNGNSSNNCADAEKFDDLRVLVVDDDNMNLTVAKGMLSSYGVSVETAQSGEVAIEKCRIEDFDMVFMDIMMPSMDGVECMNRIRQIRSAYIKDIPFIALTANATSSARGTYMQEGFDEFMTKPIEVCTLLRMLRRFGKRRVDNV